MMGYAEGGPLEGVNPYNLTMDNLWAMNSKACFSKMPTKEEYFAAQKAFYTGAHVLYHVMLDIRGTDKKECLAFFQELHKQQVEFLGQVDGYAPGTPTPE